MMYEFKMLIKMLIWAQAFSINDVGWRESTHTILTLLETGTCGIAALLIRYFECDALLYFLVSSKLINFLFHLESPVSMCLGQN